MTSTGYAYYTSYKDVKDNDEEDFVWRKLQKEYVKKAIGRSNEVSRARVVRKIMRTIIL